MRLEGERIKPVESPAWLAVERALGRVNLVGQCRYLILQDETGSYIQVAGSPSACMLELRLQQPQRHFRAYQDSPVVPFEDGATLVFAGNSIRLQRDEWFKMDQAIDAFREFYDRSIPPASVRWRDISSLLGL